MMRKACCIARDAVQELWLPALQVLLACAVVFGVIWLVITIGTALIYGVLGIVQDVFC